MKTIVYWQGPGMYKAERTNEGLVWRWVKSGTGLTFFASKQWVTARFTLVEFREL